MSMKNYLSPLNKARSFVSRLYTRPSFCFSSGEQKPNSSQSDFQKREAEFIKKSNVDVSGTYINQENIRKKQEELRNSKELPLHHYKIKKPGQYYDPKSRPNPTRDVFNFHEDALLQKNYLMQIYGLANGYFTVNDVWYPGSIVAFPRQVFLWDVQTAADIRAHSFDILDVIKPTPNYVIIGTGKDKYPLEESLYKRFKDKGIKIEVIPTFEACSTFNVCNEDGLNIVAFLIPANL